MISSDPGNIGARCIAPCSVCTIGRDQSRPYIQTRIGSLCERGFTLLELLVAMTVFSLLLLLLYNGLNAAARTSRVVETRAESIDNVMAVHRLLRREFAQFQPVNLKDTRGDVAVFSGNASSVRWVAPLPAHRGGHALYWLTLSAQTGTSRPPLRLEYIPVGAGAATARDEVTLFSDVTRFDCRYLRAGDGQRAPQWLPEWNKMTEVPIAVRLSMQRRGEPETLEWMFLIPAGGENERRPQSDAPGSDAR